jgi:hypothetical protein
MAKGSHRAAAAVVIAAMVLAGSWHWTTAREGGDEQVAYEGLPIGPVSHGGGYFILEFDDPVFTPTCTGYSLPLDLGTVLDLDRVAERLDITQERLAFLAANGMVGLANGTMWLKYYDAYECLEEQWQLPTLVTTDSMLDAYHLLFEKVLRELESDRLFEQVELMSRRMMELSEEQAGSISGELAGLAEDNAFFFAVAVRLLDPSARIPGAVAADVDETVQLISDANEVTEPPRFDHREDFTQYRPRSHYTSSERLERYFRAMMWYGRMNFRGDDAEETRRAVLASVTLMDDEVARSAYIRLSSVLGFIVGAADDLTPYEYADAADGVFGSLAPGFDGLKEGGKVAELQKLLGALRLPRILSDVASSSETTWGLRIFGQAFVIDSYVFQRCVYDKVSDRFMPSCIDVMSALGSDGALRREPFGDYEPIFEANLMELREDIAGWDQYDWNASLYTAWLHSIQSLHEETPDVGYPAFMRTDAWDAKQLNAQLGSWTQLTHDTLLYRKQSYTLWRGVGGMTNFTYVEPVPTLYSRLGAMVDTTLAGLKRLGLSTPDMVEQLSAFSAALGSLERVAVAELEGREASSDDVWAARKAYEVTRWEVPDDHDPPREGEFFESRTVVVSDVHTDPNSGLCLEEGVGFVHLMVVVVPTADGPVACVGPVFEHHEFAQPLSAGRLTDEEWQAMLEGGTAPAMAPWARDFMV